MKHLHHIPAIREGLEHLLANDPVFSKTGIETGGFSWPYMGPGFSGLVRIVIGQQLSTQAAETLWQRFEDALYTVSPNSVLTLKDEEMRLLGLSHQKASYIRGLAQAVRRKEFDPRALEALPDGKVHAAITELKGFGNWSAHMYLMFCLARPDVWPAGDLGIQEGMRLYLRKKDRPTAEQTEKAGKRFVPHRTAASLLLWRMKAAEQA